MKVIKNAGCMVQRCRLTFFLVCAGVSSASAAINGTNTWIGAASGGNWNVESNWECFLADGTSSTLASTLAAKTVWDFSKLTDGAVVTADCAAVISGLIFAENAGTVKLADNGGNQAIGFRENPTFTVPSGTVFDFCLTYKINWSDDLTALVLQGGGEFKIDGNNFKLNTGRIFRVADGSTLSIDKYFAPSDGGNGLYITTIELADDHATLALDSDAVVARLVSSSGKKGNVKLNGHTLWLTAGANGANAAYNGGFEGPGTVRFSGGNEISLASSASSSATFAVWNADLSPTAAATFGPGANLLLDTSGWVKPASSQSVATLAGDGAAGAVVIPAGATFSVTGGDTSESVYGAAIRGEGTLVKTGSDYTLTLRGANTHTGGTSIEEGTLRLAHDIVFPEGLLCKYEFEDATLSAQIRPQMERRWN
jgi:autotransporter-associated beta strand protein